MNLPPDYDLGVCERPFVIEYGRVGEELKSLTLPRFYITAHGSNHLKIELTLSSYGNSDSCSVQVIDSIGDSIFKKDSVFIARTVINNVPYRILHASAYEIIANPEVWKRFSQLETLTAEKFTVEFPLETALPELPEVRPRHYSVLLVLEMI